MPFPPGRSTGIAGRPAGTAPAIGDALQALGAAIRYGTALTARVREIAILAVAAHWDSAFERYAHEAVARTAGLDDGVLAALRTGGEVHLDDPVERAALRLVRARLERADLDDAGYADAVGVLGAQAIVELSTLVGYYATLALQLRLFGVGAPPRQKRGQATAGGVAISRAATRP